MIKYELGIGKIKQNKIKRGGIGAWGWRRDMRECNE